MEITWEIAGVGLCISMLFNMLGIAVTSSLPWLHWWYSVFLLLTFTMYLPADWPHWPPKPCTTSCYTAPQRALIAPFIRFIWYRGFGIFHIHIRIHTTPGVWSMGIKQAIPAMWYRRYCPASHWTLHPNHGWLLPFYDAYHSCMNILAVVFSAICLGHIKEMNTRMLMLLH